MPAGLADWAVVVVNEEEVRSVGDQLREFVVGILIGRRIFSRSSTPKMPLSKTSKNRADSVSYYRANSRDQPHDISLSYRLTFKMHLLD